MTAEVKAPPKEEVLRVAADALDRLLRELSREETDKLTAAGANELPPPRCKLYEEEANLLREHAFRLLRNRSPRVRGEVKALLESLRRRVQEQMVLLEPHYRVDKERDINLAEEYWRCGLTQVALALALDDDWQFLNQCVEREEAAETRNPSERQWVRELPEKERQRRRQIAAAGLGETLRPLFTGTEKAKRFCTHSVSLIAQCCPRMPRPDPVVDEGEVARMASRYGIPLDEARRLLWQSEHLLESVLLEESPRKEV